VLARTGRKAAAICRGDVRAGRSLNELTAPQKRLPPWRIISPPPVDKLRRYYAEAQRLTGVHWTFLAAIHLVETRMGRIRGTSRAGAQGPMQFMPSTWETYGAGGDINDPRDAILGAARLLQANGAPEDMAAAIYRYNPSQHYVRAITQYARTMQLAPYTFRGYWHWRVLYRDVRGLYLLPSGYPRVHPVLLEPR
jgi:soluble lytic murein transglycosylase-like protein